MKKNRWIAIIGFVVSLVLLNSCSNMGTEVNEARLQEVRNLKRSNDNNDAMKVARRSNDATYSEALVFMLREDRGSYLSDEELAKVQAMNLPSLQTKLDFQYRVRARSAEMFKWNKARHHEYLASDEYKNLKKSYANKPSNNYSNNNYQRTSGSTSSSGYTQQTTDRYNSAVDSAAEKERIRVRDSQW